MTEDQKKNLETQLWGIANLLRGKISADDYRDYILGFIFFKYLSEKQYLYANELLEAQINNNSDINRLLAAYNFPNLEIKGMFND